MSHENSETVQFDGNAWWVINGNTGEKLRGPFATSHEADNYAKIRTNMFGGDSLQELGDLGELMGEGYRKQIEQNDNSTPLPTEFGPTERTPDGGLQETDYGMYTAQRRPSDEMPKGPHMMPNGQMMGLGQLAQDMRGYPKGSQPGSIDRSKDMWDNILRDTDKGQAGPQNKYFRPSPGVKPMGPMPNPQTPRIDPSLIQPGESESDYIKRILRGG